MEFAEIRKDRDAFRRWLANILADVIGKPANGRIPRFPNDKAFLKEMSTCMTAMKVGDNAPDPATFKNWQDGTSVPQERFAAPLFKVLLGDTPDSQKERERAWALWKAANKETKQSRPPPSRLGKQPLAAPPTPPGDSPDEAESGASDWKPANDKPLRPGVAVLRVHAPPRGSNTPRVFPLKVDLAFGEWEEWLDGDQYATVALTGAVLIPTYEGCQPLEGTQLGRPGNSHGNLDCPADVWVVKGPHPTSPHLVGEPAAGEPLCTIVCSGDDDDMVALALRSSPRALAVVPRDLGDANAAKVKVLQALLQECEPKDRDGLITWGRAVLKRKQRDATDR